MRGRYDLVDLMGDVARSSHSPIETVLHIVKADGAFRVVQDGRMADGLMFDEMLGQVVNLLHPALGRAHYPMLTREEIDAQERRRAERIAERNAQS